MSIISAKPTKSRVIDTFGSLYSKASVDALLFQDRWTWRFWFLGVLGITLFLGLLMFRGGPSPSLLTWILFFIGAAVILLQPRYGIYLILFLTLIGDARLTFWFPFVKNLSSSESLMFLHNAVIISPLEVYFLLTLVSWLGRSAMRRDIKLYFSPVFLISLVFLVIVASGLTLGLMKGGSLNIALWESRAIFYMPVMVFLTSNLLDKRSHFSNLMWFAMVALFIESLFGIHHFLVILGASLAGVDRIAAHAAAIHFNTFFIYLASVWLFGASWTKRLVLPLMAPFFLLTYVAMQRRASFLTLGVAIVLIAIVLFRENRKLFFAIMPVVGVVAIVYLGVFWNSSGALGVPAQAVKSVIASDQANAADIESDLYRLIENYNALFNMRLSPLLGSGFGRKLIFIVPLPDISGIFEFWEYIIHNSVAWVWIKTGVFGFYSMLFLIGSSLMAGMRAVIRIQDSDMRAVVFTATAYVFMHFMYAYVDMSWDVESMVYVGAMIGIICCAERVTELPVPLKPNRWPWQQARKSAPGILPMPGSE